MVGGGRVHWYFGMGGGCPTPSTHPAPSLQLPSVSIWANPGLQWKCHTVHQHLATALRCQSGFIFDTPYGLSPQLQPPPSPPLVIVLIRQGGVGGEEDLSGLDTPAPAAITHPQTRTCQQWLIAFFNIGTCDIQQAEDGPPSLHCTHCGRRLRKFKEEEEEEIAAS